MPPCLWFNIVLRTEVPGTWEEAAQGCGAAWLAAGTTVPLSARPPSSDESLCSLLPWQPIFNPTVSIWESSYFHWLLQPCEEGVIRVTSIHENRVWGHPQEVGQPVMCIDNTTSTATGACAHATAGTATRHATRSPVA